MPLLSQERLWLRHQMLGSPMCEQARPRSSPPRHSELVSESFSASAIFFQKFITLVDNPIFVADKGSERG